MNVTAVILARSGSKGLPHKNISLLNGISLLQRGIDYLQNTLYITEIIVSSDSIDILEQASNLGATIHHRSPELSSDTSTSISVLQSIAHQLNLDDKLPDYFAYIQLTEPFRPPSIMDQCINILINNSHFDSAFAAFETHKNYWSAPSSSPHLLSRSIASETPRQSKSPIYREDTGIALAVRPHVWLEGNRIGSSPCIVPYTSFHSVIDIHSISDLRFAEHLESFIDV